MYSTSMKDNRYLVDCLAVSNEISLEKFVVDTGAKFTCCNYRIIDSRLKEEQLKGCEVKLIGGFVKGDYSKFYKFYLQQFTIGNIDMGEQYIWITFDKRITDIILGMDILKQVIFIANPYNQKIYFCKNISDYKQNFKLTSING